MPRPFCVHCFCFSFVSLSQMLLFTFLYWHSSDLSLHVIKSQRPIILSFFFFYRTYNPNLAYLESGTSSLSLLSSFMCPIRPSPLQLASTLLLSLTHTYAHARSFSPPLFSLGFPLEPPSCVVQLLFFYFTLCHFFFFTRVWLSKTQLQVSLLCSSVSGRPFNSCLPLEPVARRTDGCLDLSGCRPPGKKQNQIIFSIR